MVCVIVWVWLWIFGFLVLLISNCVWVQVVVMGVCNLCVVLVEKLCLVLNVLVSWVIRMLIVVCRGVSLLGMLCVVKGCRLLVLCLLIFKDSVWMGVSLCCMKLCISIKVSGSSRIEGSSIDISVLCVVLCCLDRGLVMCSMLLLGFCRVSMWNVLFLLKLFCRVGGSSVLFGLFEWNCILFFGLVSLI